MSPPPNHPTCLVSPVPTETFQGSLRLETPFYLSVNGLPVSLLDVRSVTLLESVLVDLPHVFGKTKQPLHKQRGS